MLSTLCDGRGGRRGSGVGQVGGGKPTSPPSAAAGGREHPNPQTVRPEQPAAPQQTATPGTQVSGTLAFLVQTSFGAGFQGPFPVLALWSEPHTLHSLQLHLSRVPKCPVLSGKQGCFLRWEEKKGAPGRYCHRSNLSPKWRSADQGRPSPTPSFTLHLTPTRESAEIRRVVQANPGKDTTELSYLDQPGALPSLTPCAQPASARLPGAPAFLGRRCKFRRLMQAAQSRCPQGSQSSLGMLQQHSTF